MTTESQVNDYLARLRTSLTGMTVAEREDIVEEIRMHIRERSGDPEPASKPRWRGLVRPRIGTAISHRSTGAAGADQHFACRDPARRAALGRNRSGRFHRLRHRAHRIHDGSQLPAVALIKPFFPANTGFWVGPDQFSFSFRLGATMTNPASPVHEVLGWWLIPVCLVRVR